MVTMLSVGDSTMIFLRWNILEGDSVFVYKILHHIKGDWRSISMRSIRDHMLSEAVWTPIGWYGHTHIQSSKAVFIHAAGIRQPLRLRVWTSHKKWCQANTNTNQSTWFWRYDISESTECRNTVRKSVPASFLPSWVLVSADGFPLKKVQMLDIYESHGRGGIGGRCLETC